jgi:hypothetical protein
MATNPPPERLAREILDIFVSHFRKRPGEVLQNQNFLVHWPQRGYRSDDFSTAIIYAIERGWLELAPGGRYRLTQAGFDDA